ncbi:MAG: c-type cytochrome [Gemmatimonas sp.]
MTRGRRIALTVAVVLAVEAALVLAGGAAVVWSGIVDVAATVRHGPVARWFLHGVMRRSVAAHARGLSAPGFDDGMALRGAGHYRGGCAPCHGAPGERPSAVERNAEPTPPIYADFERWSPEELFWIVKHGVKLTAMPPWPEQGRDDEVWDMVSFLVLLPEMSPPQYRSMSDDSAATVPPLQALAGAPEASRTCAACHGADGRGRGGAFPRIAGLPKPYLARALREFRDGTRASGMMERVAAPLRDGDIAAIAAYFAAASNRPPGQPSSSDAEGERIARYGTTAGRFPPCQACHREPSRDGDIPDLGGQPEWYLRRQLALFRSGARAGTPEARAMSSIASSLSESQSAAVSAYFAAPGGKSAAR